MIQGSAIKIYSFGGPEVLEEVHVRLDRPAAGHALVRVEFAGVNLVDVRVREGTGRRPSLPAGIGIEGAGTIEAVGAGVDDVRIGDRVAWVAVNGSYATHLVVPADHLIPVPDDVEAKLAAASALQGLTAHCLTTASYQLAPDDVCLIRAAAGGVGLMLCRMAARIGARIIGTVSKPEKAALARDAGADHVLIESEGSLVAQVRQLTGGEGVHVVYDGVGKCAFEASLGSLRRDGVLVLYGEASGPVPPLELSSLAANALRVTRGGLAAYFADHAALRGRAAELFAWIADGEIMPRIDELFALGEAAQAHERLARRQAFGKLLLAPAIKSRRASAVW